MYRARLWKMNQNHKHKIWIKQISVKELKELDHGRDFSSISNAN